jgi:hypothetical protein
MTAGQSDTIQIDMPALLEEMRRYLETVALFRAEGCEPHWASNEQQSERSGEQLTLDGLLVAE